MEALFLSKLERIISLNVVISEGKRENKWRSNHVVNETIIKNHVCMCVVAWKSISSTKNAVNNDREKHEFT